MKKETIKKLSISLIILISIIAVIFICDKSKLNDKNDLEAINSGRGTVKTYKNITKNNSVNDKNLEDINKNIEETRKKSGKDLTSDDIKVCIENTISNKENKDLNDSVENKEHKSESNESTKINKDKDEKIEKPEIIEIKKNIIIRTKKSEVSNGDTIVSVKFSNNNESEKYEVEYEGIKFRYVEEVSTFVATVNGDVDEEGIRKDIEINKLKQ